MQTYSQEHWKDVASKLKSLVTTKAWKGGKSEALDTDRYPLLETKRFKTYSLQAADEPWRRSKKSWLNDEEGLLKENIDGEALLWAHKESKEGMRQEKY